MFNRERTFFNCNLRAGIQLSQHESLSNDSGSAKKAILWPRSDSSSPSQHCNKSRKFRGAACCVAPLTWLPTSSWGMGILSVTLCRRLHDHDSLLLPELVCTLLSFQHLLHPLVRLLSQVLLRHPLQVCQVALPQVLQQRRACESC